jgi:hypothetical protein
VTLYQKTVNLDAGEDIEILEIPLKEITAKIRNEEIDHGMVLLAFFFLENDHSWLQEDSSCRKTTSLRSIELRRGRQVMGHSGFKPIWIKSAFLFNTTF